MGSSRLEDYIELHLQANPGTPRNELVEQLENAIAVYRSGPRRQCSSSIWIIGSAQSGPACFTCITGEGTPDNDYEIDFAGVATPSTLATSL